MLGLEVETREWASVFFRVFEDIKLGAEVGRVVRAAHERATRNVTEAFIERNLLVFGKSIGVDVFDDGQVAWRGAQVLAEGQNGDIGGKEVVHGGEDFLVHFAQAKHESALGGDFSADHCFGFFQNCETAVILRTRANEGSEALDSFKVVIENVRTGIHDHLQSPVAIIEIGHEHLDDDAGIDGAHGLDGMLKVFGATIAQIIASDGGDDHVAQLHAASGLGDAEWFVGFEGIGLCGLHGAKSTGAGAFFPRDHEGGGALTPAFPTIRALGLFADGDELEVGDERFRGPKSGIVWQADLDPIRLALLMEGGVHFHLRSVTSAHRRRG